MNFFSCNALKYVSLNNNESKIRPEKVNINPYSNKCSGSCSNINDPYSKLCVPDVVKNINIKVFNLM